MKNIDDEFIQEGIERYYNAYSTIISFEDKMINIIKKIISKRKKWGNFVPELNTVKPTRRNRDYHYLGVYIEGINKLNNENRSFEASIDWDHEKSWIYCAWYNRKIDVNQIDAPDKIIVSPESWATVFKMYLDLKDLDLERDYNLLFNELLKYA